LLALLKLLKEQRLRETDTENDKGFGFSQTCFIFDRVLVLVSGRKSEINCTLLVENGLFSSATNFVPRMKAHCDNCMNRLEFSALKYTEEKTRRVSVI